MSTKSPWGNIGAWAAEAERAEAEEREDAERAAKQAAAAPPASFPSLKESVTAAGKQKKKTKMTLQEFTMASTFGKSASTNSASRLTHEEMMRLPTGPKERSAEEMQYGRLGGGFANYGTRSGGPSQGRIRDYSDSEGGYGSGMRRGYGGFVDDDRRRGPPMSPRGSEFDDMPSRADEGDNWASMKRSPQPAFDTPAHSGSARPSRYAALGGGGGGFSKADEVDNWASLKKPLPPPPSGPVTGRSSSFGSGFRSEMRPRPEPERWTRDFSNNQERLVVEQPPQAVKVNKPNPFGAARPREEVLAEKGLDWKKLDTEIEVKKAAETSRPTSSQSSRPGSSQSRMSEGVALQQHQLQRTVDIPAAKPKPKVNPFGDAKPREVLLEEKGLDWRKIDLEMEHKRIDRPDTEEEKILKDEIEHLKEEKSSSQQANLHEVILQKERDLELLTRDLDEKVRLSQKASDRPGSGAGRYTGPPVRPLSRSGPYEEPRVPEFMDRPRSRGIGESWPRPIDDRRGASGGRGSGFLGTRDFDRSRSRDRW